MSYISAITKRNTVLVWERTENGRELKEYPAPYYFYVNDPRGQHKTIYGDTVRKVEFDTSMEFYSARKEYENSKTKMWESDIPSDLRILSQHYYEVTPPKLNVTHLDIEVDVDYDIGFASPKNPYAIINSVALFHEWNKQLVVLCVPPAGSDKWTSDTLIKACNEILPIPEEFDVHISVCQDEGQLLRELIEQITDSDMLVGWNSEMFDFPYIAKRVELILGKRWFNRLSFPEADPPKFTEIERFNQMQIKLETSGRLLADYMHLYRKYEVAEKSSYKLASIEQEVGLGLPKLEYEGNLSELYRKDFAYFIRYNIRDTEILHGFEQKLAYVELANQMYHMSCGKFEHVLGTLKLAELAIVLHCHHVLDCVVNNIAEPVVDQSIDGALVLQPQAGIQEMIGSIDINSLYPSSIRSINISPETIIGQFTLLEAASEEIAKASDTELLLEFKDNSSTTATAAEWRDICLANKWAVSGYGTIFDQSEKGIIPTILETWYGNRKKFQANKTQSLEKADAILEKYRSRSISTN